MLGKLLGDRAGALAPLVQAAMTMFLRNRGGNMQGLLDQLSAAGLGQQAQSWVGRGGNLPVTGAQLTQAIGAPEMQQLAAQAGCTPQEAADGLAETLPKVVDQLTPKGHVPEPAVLQRQLSQLMHR